MVMMVTFKEAVSLARGCWSEVDYVTEYPEAYSLSKYGDMSIGGNGPVVVLKADGSCISFVDYLDSGDFGVTEIGAGYISEFEG